jgi:oligopeptide transport system substrate-binding protein
LLGFILLLVGIACGSDAVSTVLPVQSTVAPTFTAVPPVATSVPSGPAATSSVPSARSDSSAMETPTEAPTVAPAVALTEESFVEDAVLQRLGPEPATLDPHLTVSSDSALYVVEIFGGLVTIDRNLRIAPDLAKDWEISNGGKTYTFFLREDATFHNGKPVTAQDFKWSMERASDPALLSPVADVYLGDIEGFQDKIEGRTDNIPAIRVIDDHTLSITIDAPKVFFISKMTYPTAFVLDRENVEGNERWFTEPNGTGPFRLVEHAPGEIIRFERFDGYHLGPAKLAGVDFSLSGGDSLLMYENDEIHVTGVGLINLASILDPANPLSENVIQAPPGFDISYFGMNTNEPPFDDVKVRQALNYAVDKATLATVLLEDLVVPAKGILPPALPGYTPNISGYEYDPEKALQLLRESKYGDNLEDLPRIVLTLPGSFGATVGPVNEAIVQMWQENLGIEIEILQTEWAIFLKDLHDKRFQMFGGLAWSADYPDPENFLDGLFYSQSSNNNTKYSNPIVDSLLEQARVEQDQELRFETYHQIEQMIMDDAPWVPLWHGNGGYALLKPEVKDYFLFPMTVPRFRYAYIVEE